MRERELSLSDIERVLEESLKDCSYKEELLHGNLIHVHVNGEPFDLIMDKDAYEAEMEFAIMNDRELHNGMVDFFEEIKSYKNKEDDR